MRKINSARPEVSEACVETVAGLLRDGQLAQGAVVAQFQAELEDFFSMGIENEDIFVIPVSSGTAALHLALLAAGIKPGDMVIVPSFTFLATVAAIKMVGAVPVFAEVEPGTFGMSPQSLYDLLQNNGIKYYTKAVLPVHLFGQAVNDNIFDIAYGNNLKVIEDACQAIGATVGTSRAGTWGSVGVVSFYATKNMFCGEGGAVITPDKDIARAVTELSNHGQVEKYYASRVGYNYRMTNIAAAIGLDSLSMLVQRNQARRTLAHFYRHRLVTLAARGYITVPVRTEGQGRDDGSHVWHQFTIICDPVKNKSRDDLLKFLRAAGIGATVNYPTPIHKMPPYRRPEPRLPLAYTEWLCDHVLSLPIHPGVTEDDVNYICEKMEEYYGD